MYIKSPCINNCCLDTQDICMGCFRHSSEIMAWQGASPEKKQQILERANNRKNNKEIKQPSPGVNRENRISEEGLMRLERQLKSGRRISQGVLQQWIKRYGKDAKQIVDKYSRTF